jgi:uncharacterized protein (TIGR02271 family)
MNSNDQVDEMIIPLVSEDVTVTKREVVKGRARIHIVTDSVDEKLPADLMGEDVEIRHVPVNRYLDDGEARPQSRSEGDVVIIPVIEEVAVIEKRLLLREELHIHRHAVSKPAELSVTLRKQRAEIEILKEDGTSTSDLKEN